MTSHTEDTAPGRTRTDAGPPPDEADWYAVGPGDQIVALRSRPGARGRRARVIDVAATLVGRRRRARPGRPVLAAGGSDR